MNNLFSGRIARLNYFVASLVIAFSFLALAIFLIKFLGVIGMLILMLVGIAGIFFSFSLAIRRLHDIGWSGWLALLFIVPCVNFIFGLLILFIPGNSGGNEYGPAQLEGINFKETFFPSQAATTAQTTSTPPASPPPTPPPGI